MPTIEQVTQAYLACNMLKDKELPFKFSYAVALLERHIEPVFKAYMVEEDKYIKQFAKKDETGDVIFDERGRFTFDNPEDQKCFDEALGPIKEEVADLEIKKRKVTPPENIPPQILMALLDFIDFDEEEEDE